MKGFSIIIPTLNRTSFLLNTLKHLTNQKFSLPYEVLIIDQSKLEDADVKKFIKNFDFIKYHYITTFRGLPEARNYGAKQSNYENILFLDDDIECNNLLLQEHYKSINQPNIGVVAGGVTEKHNPNVGNKVGVFNLWKADPITGFHNDLKKYVDHAKGCNFSVKKDIFLKLNGIDIALTKGAALYEELDFCLRLRKTNHQVYFNYAAHVNHLAAATGGCRVLDINKYVFSLSRNRTIIIERHLKWYHKITSKLYLFKLILAYAFSYKQKSVLMRYFEGVREGKTVA